MKKIMNDADTFQKTGQRNIIIMLWLWKPITRNKNLVWILHFQFKFQQTKYRLEIISQQHIMCETSLSSLSDKFHIDEETENYKMWVLIQIFSIKSVIQEENLKRKYGLCLLDFLQIDTYSTYTN